MGTGISVNYEQIVPLFNLDGWKVSDAYHKETHEHVSLWQMDYDFVQQIKSKAKRERYLTASLQSVQQMRRLHHPQILKISEVNENLKALDFAAEPVMSCLAYEQSFSPDDGSYIAYQIASALKFLHKNARIVMFGLSTSSICLTKSLCVKVCNFRYGGAMINDFDGAIPRLGDYGKSKIHPDVSFCSPEYTAKRQCTGSTDIFSFGCIFASIILNRKVFDCETVDEHARAILQPFSLPIGASPAASELIKKCLQTVPERRPTIDEVVTSDAWNSLAVKSLLYLDVILTKTKEDKYSFFKGIAETLSAFSIRLLQSKMLPVLISEVIFEPLFGPVLIPLIFEIGRSLDKPTFYAEILQPLESLLKNPHPPECMFAVLNSMPIIIDQTDDGMHYSTCYPIIAAALSSSVSQLHKEALKHMPTMINKMTNESVDNEVVPAIIELFSVSDDVHVVCSCIKCLANCLPKLSHDSFSTRVAERITAAWNRLHMPAGIAEACVYLIERLKASPEVTMREIVPMASEVLGAPNSDPPIQLKLCEFIKDATMRFVRSKKGGGTTTGNWLNKKKEDDKPKPRANLSVFDATLNRAGTAGASSFSAMKKHHDEPLNEPPQPVQPAPQEPPRPAPVQPTQHESPRPAPVQAAPPVSPRPAPVEQPVQLAQARKQGSENLFAGLKTRQAMDPAKRASTGGTMFSGMKMGGGKPRPQ